MGHIPGTGLLSGIVWPVYMGVATGDPGPVWAAPLVEPFGDINYNRGQINWVPQKNGDVLGTAEVFVPKGVYTYLVFCAGPLQHGIIGCRPLEQPLIFDRPGIVDISPIRNRDYLPRLPV